MWLRRLHRGLGLAVGPFLLLPAVLGFLLLFRLKGWYDFSSVSTLVKWHNLEAIGLPAGVALATGLLLLVGTGLALRVQIWRRTHRARK